MAPSGLVAREVSWELKVISKPSFNTSLVVFTNPLSGASVVFFRAAVLSHNVDELDNADAGDFKSKTSRGTQCVNIMGSAVWMG